ncbi:MAG TPA: FAD-dependent oxidoreductase [Stellaceae bacterium]|nr:FAD-dependent oxidoreductase [Stellaceae bacterium]
MEKINGILPVLIVGAGPVGLALAGDLGWRGVECMIVEQSDGTIIQPRMDMVGIRTMEFCRRWGIVKNVEASPYPRDYPQDNVYLTALNGWELGREPFPSMGDDKPPPSSPQKRERCPQNMFDPILRAFAEARPGVQLRYRTRLVGFREEADCVVAELEDVESGTQAEIRARYLIGCDGAASKVRSGLGIEMTGRPIVTYTTNVIFRCPDLVSKHDKGKAYRHIFLGPDGTWSTIVAINGRDQWRMSIIGSDERKEMLEEADIRAAIRRAAGFDFDYEILSVMPWVRRELVANTYGGGRCFLAGDSAHMMSPTGGFGMNTGIGDAVDLSWKLTAMLEGWGGPHLLASYEAERLPIGWRNVREASRNLGRMKSPGANKALLEDTAEGAATRQRVGREFSEAMRHEWFTLGMHLGYRYEASPICWPDGTEPTPDDPMNYRPTARPGSRAPHVWLADGRSTLDLFGRGFALLRLGADAPDAAPFRNLAEELHIPVTVTSLDEPAVARAYERALILVRPDGHVAWRGDAWPSDIRALIDCIRGAVPARAAAAA